MARGWESKSVEAQIESAEERSARSRAIQVSARQIALEREREGIELSRTRIIKDIADAKNAGYRAMLERSLKFLDDKLAGLAAE